MCIISLDSYRICFSILNLVKFIFFYERCIAFILCFVIDLIDKFAFNGQIERCKILLGSGQLSKDAVRLWNSQILISNYVTGGEDNSQVMNVIIFAGYKIFCLFLARQPPSGLGPPHSRGF